MVGCEQSGAPLSGARPTANLKRGSRIKSGTAQVVTVVGILIAGGDRQHAQLQHLFDRVLDAGRIAPVAQTGGEPAGQPVLAFRFAQQQQAAVRGQASPIESDGDFLAGNRWQIER